MFHMLLKNNISSQVDEPERQTYSRCQLYLKEYSYILDDQSSEKVLHILDKEMAEKNIFLQKSCTFWGFHFCFWSFCDSWLIGFTPVEVLPSWSIVSNFDSNFFRPNQTLRDQSFLTLFFFFVRMNQPS